jgi:hypothetical protein
VKIILACLLDYKVSTATKVALSLADFSTLIIVKTLGCLPYKSDGFIIKDRYSIVFQYFKST